MEKKERIIELTKNGDTPKQILQKLQVEFGQHAPRKTCVYKWHAQAKLGVEGSSKHGKPGRKHDEELLNKIAGMFEQESFASLGHIARTLNIPKSTVHRYVTKYLGRVYKKTKWIPHLLTEPQKKLRVKACIELVEILQACQKLDWRNIITGDQSWFTYWSGYDGAWLALEDNAPIFEESHIQVKKIMITVIWGVYGIYLIDVLPQGMSFNSEYFIKHIINKIAEKKQEIWNESDHQKIWLHLDNCRVHNSKESLQKTEDAGFCRTPHPPYSPDIAPSDFFLFGYTKVKLKGHRFEEESDLVEEITDILNKISVEKRKEVFETWIKRCNHIIAQAGNYYIK